MRRTYRSKKETGGLDPRDVIQNVDEKSSKFDAFYIQNIKHTKRELSCLGVSGQNTASNRVRKKKFVKRLKEPEVNLACTSSATFLTPDKSLRVNKAEDLFDQLLNSSLVKKSPILNYVSRNSRKKEKNIYNIRDRKPIKKYNYSSSDNSESDKENFGNGNKSHNESDIKSHKLLLEKDSKYLTNLQDSTENIQNNLSLFFDKTETNSLTPKNDLMEIKYSHNDKSPLCSTPYREKYRGHSIYKFSPISVHSGKIIHTSIVPENLCTDLYSLRQSMYENKKDMKFNDREDHNGENLRTVKKQKTNKNSESLNNIHGLKEENVENITNEINIKVTLEDLDLNKKYKNELAEDSVIKDPSVIDHTFECSKLLKFTKNNKSKDIEINSKDKENPSITLTDDELPSEPFIGFTNCSTSIDTDNNISIDMERYKEISRESLKSCSAVSMGDNSTAANLLEFESGHVSINESNNLETISLYDTCSENESPEISLRSTKEPVVKIEILNKSVLEKYKICNCLVKPNKNITSNSTGNHESFESLYSSNTEEESALETSNSLFDINPLCFVTTRRGNEKLRDSFLNNSHSSLSSSSINIDKTVVTNNDMVDKEQTFYSVPNVDYINDTINISNITVRKSRRNSPGEIHKPTADTIEESSISAEDHAEKSEIEPKDNILEQLPVAIPKESVLTSMNEKYIDKESDMTYVDINDTLKPLNTTLTCSEFQVKSINKDIAKESLSTSSNDLIRTYINQENDAVTPLRQSTRIKQSSAGLKEYSRKSHISVTTRSSTVSRHPNEDTDAFNISEIRNPIVLQPGKRWERSLSIYRRMTTMVDGPDSILDKESLKHKGRNYRHSVISTMEMQDLNTSLHNESIKSRRSTFVSNPIRSANRLIKDSNVSQISIRSSTIFEDLQGFLTEDCDDTVVNLSKLSLGDPEVDVRILENFHETSNRSSTARDFVLRRCNQTDALLFDECYPDTALKNCRKIGEGVYGEVFLWRANDGRARVLKIIPVAGELVVNGEKQKDYHQIISEIVIAMELSALGAPIPEIESHFDEGKNVETLDLHSVENATDVFNKVLAVRLVYGGYPSRLLDLWDLYDECKGSDNDNPAILPPEQHYIVLELANAGQDLESYQFNNAEQAYALLQQVAFGLAVAEEAYQFEHRDLHWGNVLIAPTDQKYSTFVLRGRAHRVRTCGVKATIIDYSLSRLSLDGRALCCDLADDESLFDALGDYQFEVYRCMRDRLGNDWKNYDPYTNILWLHYTVDKMITALRYTRTNTKIHKHYIAKLKDIKNRILYHGSACEYVIEDNEIYKKIYISAQK